jgi:hypothetical protein
VSVISYNQALGRLPESMGENYVPTMNMAVHSKLAYMRRVVNGKIVRLPSAWEPKETPRALGVLTETLERLIPRFFGCMNTLIRSSYSDSKY